MPQQRTGRQSALKALAVLKFLGAALFIVAGVLVLVGANTPDFYEALVSTVEEAGADAETVANFGIGLTALGVIAIVTGLGGVAHGVIDMRSTNSENSAVGSIVFGALGCVLDILLLTGGISAATLIMTGMNVARTVLAALINSDNKKMAQQQAFVPPYAVQQGMPPQQAMPPQGQPGQDSQRPPYGPGGERRG